MKHSKTILLIGIILFLLFTFINSAFAAGEVVFNEIAWMGTQADPKDEWIELLNTTSSPISVAGWYITSADGTPIIGPLTGTIQPYDFYLLERYEAATDTPANFVYDSAQVMENNPPGGEVLYLYDGAPPPGAGVLIDTANIEGYPPDETWTAGNNANPWATMERIDPLAPDTDANWITNDTLLTSGTDAKGRPISGTPHNNNSGYTPTYSRPGSFLCLDYDGIDDHLEIEDAANLTLGADGTLEAWIYVYEFSAGAGIIHKGNGATGEAYSLQFGFGTQNDQLQLVVRDGSGADTLTGNTKLAANIWYHVAGSWDGSDMKLYVNGIEDNTLSSTRAARDSAENLIIGAVDDIGTASFSGRIDEVRIWDDARTIDEIRANMCQKVSGSEAGLASYWEFDELSGTFCYDFATATGKNVGIMTDMYWPEDRVCSSAPIGDVSAYDYGTPFSVNLAASDGDDLTASPDGGVWDVGLDSGMHVYRVDGIPNFTAGPIFLKSLGAALRYWGVFVTGGTTPTYTVTYNYDGYPGIADESTLKLVYRKNNCDFWKSTKATLDTGANTLTLSSQSGTQFILGSSVDSRNALDFDGTDDYVTIADESSLDLGATGTLEAWINVSAHSADAGIIHKGDQSDASDESYYLRLGTASNTIVLGLDDGAGTTASITSASTLTAGEWYHVAGVWDNNIPSMKIYINGVINQTGASATTAQNSTGNLNIGQQYRFGTASPHAPFDGTIDEVRVWGTARTQTQIRDFMCKKLTGSEAGLVGYWRFDEDTGTNCPDYDFGTANDGTMTNMDPATDRVCSEAPIGDDSAYGYGTTTYISSATLYHTDGDYFFATQNTGWGNASSGLQVYRVDESPVYPPDIATVPYAYGSIGLTPPPGWSSIDYYRYWGVFATDWGTTPPTYDVIYNYAGNPSEPADETELGLAKRDNYCDRTWIDASATLNTTTNTLTKTGESGTEYVLGGKNAPLAIALAAFYAEPDDSNGCIRITWETASEVDTIGFQLWRSDTLDGPYTLISDSFKASQAVTETKGAEYSYLDCNVDLKTDGMTYYYKLEEIDMDNTKDNPMYGPIGPVTDTVSAVQGNSSVKPRSQNNWGCFISTLCQ